MRLRIILMSLAVFALATMAGAQTQIAGTFQCGKPDQQHAIEVGDSPGHVFVISQTKCSWTKPLEIAGIQSKDDVYAGFSEVSGNSSRYQSYGICTMTNGDKAYVRPRGSATIKDGVPVSAEGKWTFVGGTGKLKGLKGKGTFKSTTQPDGGSTVEIEGDYTLPK
ncbi:MAG: hypothetical protein LAP13_21835 [Acidobacteriia bacterium]|nr:hypothetical protein [Terriglobia bacterium]